MKTRKSWSLSEETKKAIKKEAQTDTHASVAKRYKISLSTVKYILDPKKANERARRWQKRNRKYFLSLLRAYAEKHKHPCKDCKKLVYKSSVRCQSCENKRRIK